MMRELGDERAPPPKDPATIERAVTAIGRDGERMKQARAKM